MLDKDGYRPNVGIILVNRRNEVFWIHGACSGRWRRAG